jgi:iron complex transport system substrate-binding protein
MGATEVPDAPKRIVVLTNEGTEALLALGVTPVGAVKSWLGDPWYDHIAEYMKGVTVVGTEHAPNLEVIAALRPDLILGNKLRQEEVYSQLSAIAPTVFSTRLRGDWQVNLMVYAQALGKQADGQALLDAFDARTKSIAERLGERRNEQISLVRFMPGRTRIYYNDTFAGIILDQIGFKRPPAQDKARFADEVIKERIPEMAGDRLFYFVYETGDSDALKAEAEWTAEPLWRTPEVVREGRVHRVSDAVWNTAGGIIAANRMLDDIEKIYGLE